MAAPARFGPYDVVSVLGRGGMGTVFRARHRALGCTRAVKVLEDHSPARVARFEREALALARVRDRHVVAVHDSGREANRPWFAMDLVEGATLETVLAAGVTVERALELIEKTARGVQALHERGFVHRDVKPANVVVDAEGEPVVIDLGVVGGEDFERLTRTGAHVGTLLYLAPEVVAGGARDPGPTVDVYALGCVLWEALVREPPIPATTPHEFLAAVATRELPPLGARRRGLPLELDAICARALAKDPAKRYPTARELADDLAAIRAGRPTSASAVAEGSSRGRIAVAVVACVVALVVLAGTIALVAASSRETGRRALGERVASTERQLAELELALRAPPAKAPTVRAASELAQAARELAATKELAPELVARAGAVARRAEVVRGLLLLRRSDVAGAAAIASAVADALDERALAPLLGGIAALASPADAARAEPLLARALEGERERGDLLLWRASARARLGQRASALADLDRARALGWNDARCVLVVQALAGDPELARRALRETPLSDPAFARPWALRALLQVQAGNAREANESVAAAVAYARATPELEAVARAALDRIATLLLPKLGAGFRAQDVPAEPVDEAFELARVAELAAPDVHRPELGESVAGAAAILPTSSPIRERLLAIATRVAPDSFTASLCLAESLLASEAPGARRRIAKALEVAIRARSLARDANERAIAMSCEALARFRTNAEESSRAIELLRAALATLDDAPEGGDPSVRRKLVVELVRSLEALGRRQDVVLACELAERAGCLELVIVSRARANDALGRQDAARADYLDAVATLGSSDDEALESARRLEALAREHGRPLADADRGWEAFLGRATKLPGQHREGLVRRARIALEDGRRDDARRLLEQVVGAATRPGVRSARLEAARQAVVALEAKRPPAEIAEALRRALDGPDEDE